MPEEKTVALSAIALLIKEHGLTLSECRKLLEETFAVRRINGFEIEEGWEMPSPPVPDAIPCVDFHGGDGHSLYWWRPSWGEYPSSFTAWDKTKEEDWRGKGYDTEIWDPIIEPDTGGSGYKGCLDAYIELGFNG